MFRSYRICPGVALVVAVGISLCIGGCGQEHGDYVQQLRLGTPEQRADAAAFLGAQRVSSAIPVIRAALRDTVPAVRAKAAWAVGMLRAKEALRDLLPMLRDPSRRVRQQVSEALIQIEEPEAIPALRMALQMEKDPWVHGDMQRAVQYLEQFQGDAEVNESSFE